MKKAFLILILACAAGGWWYVAQRDTDALLGLDIPTPREIVEIAKPVSTPPPLRMDRDAVGAQLSSEGALRETNRHRAEDGKDALASNAALAAAAQAKLDDMFARQYFAHESPSGDGPGDLADDAGYAHIAVGENLALGNYENDAALIQAWMDSPGHRANILSGSFTEIGIAVGRGTFEGKTTWLAVQEFGKPLAACPQPDDALRAKIDGNETRLDALKAQADALHAEMEASDKPKTQEEAEAYNAKVERYNAFAREINALIAEIQGAITVYNGQVQAFNACAGT